MRRAVRRNRWTRSGTPASASSAGLLFPALKNVVCRRAVAKLMICRGPSGPPVLAAMFGKSTTSISWSIVVDAHLEGPAVADTGLRDLDEVLRPVPPCAMGYGVGSGNVVEASLRPRLSLRDRLQAEVADRGLVKNLEPLLLDGLVALPDLAVDQNAKRPRDGRMSLGRDGAPAPPWRRRGARGPAWTRQRGVEHDGHAPHPRMTDGFAPRCAAVRGGDAPSYRRRWPRRREEWVSAMLSLRS